MSFLGFLGFAFTWLLGPIVNIVGGAMMAWFTYREWTATKGAAPVAPPTMPVAPPPTMPVAPPPAAPPAPPADQAQ